MPGRSELHYGTTYITERALLLGTASVGTSAEIDFNYIPDKVNYALRQGYNAVINLFVLLDAPLSSSSSSSEAPTSSSSSGGGVSLRLEVLETNTDMWCYVNSWDLTQSTFLHVPNLPAEKYKLTVTALTASSVVIYEQHTT